jgi:hypothetical protein
MGTFFEHFTGSSNIQSNLTIECDYSGNGYLSFFIDGEKYSSNNTHSWEMEEYYLFDHHYNSMILEGYSNDGKFHRFQATIDLDWGINHNKLLDLIEIN